MDVKNLYTYQQLYLYFIPMFTNLGFINAFTVLVRLVWFRKHLKKVGAFNVFSRIKALNLADVLTFAAPQLLTRRRRGEDAEAPAPGPGEAEAPRREDQQEAHEQHSEREPQEQPSEKTRSDQPGEAQEAQRPRITFDPSSREPREDSTLYIPGPRERERGASIRDINEKMDDGGLDPVSL